MTDVTLTRDGDAYLVRAYTPDGEEFVEDMFGGIIEVDDNMRQTGFRPWPQRNGARLVEPKWIDDQLLEEADARGLALRVL
jgi:hypothetical protein